MTAWTLVVLQRTTAWEPTGGLWSSGLVAQVDRARALSADKHGIEMM